MTPLKPYLIRSVYEWVLDNQLTPHLLVDAHSSNSILPEELVENGRIALNIRPQAAQGLILGNEEITFSARFSGKSMYIVVPIAAILAIYAKENGKGMVFEPGEHGSIPPDPPEIKPTKPQLRVVK